MLKNIDLGISKTNLDLEIEKLNLSEIEKGGATNGQNIDITLGDGNGLFFQTYKVEKDGTFAGVEVKKGQELHYVLGVVLEPETVDATRTAQSKGDIYSAEEVRKAAHDFMVNFRGGGHDVQHNRQESQLLKIVETYVTPVAFNLGNRVIKAGTWMMGSLVFDESIWKQIISGVYTGYSIEGLSNARFETA